MRIAVVGMGLSGLTASCLCASSGADVTNISYGRGSLSLSHGCIDILNHPQPSRRLNQLDEQHPYSLVGRETIKKSIRSFLRILASQGYPMVGAYSRTYKLLSATGHTRWSSLVPLTFQDGDLRDSSRIMIAELDGFRDFSSNLVRDTYRRFSNSKIDTISLPLPPLKVGKRSAAIDLAHAFDDPNWRKELLQTWKPILSGVKRLGIPAIFSLASYNEDVQSFIEELGLKVFEIPTLPPSIPGIRLESALHRFAREHQVEFIEGVRVSGVVDGRSRSPQVKGLMFHHGGQFRTMDFDAVILATGGFLNGGLIASQSGMVKETVFDLPVSHPAPHQAWVGTSPWEEQPYATFGVRVNKNMQPIGTKGKPILRNLYVIGGLIAGADRAIEGSRQGIDISSAYQATQHILDDIQ